MPPQAWSDKRERQYEHIKEGLEDHGRSEDLAEEIAARTVNKERARAGEAATASKTSTDDISSGRRGGLRSHRGPGRADPRPALRRGQAQEHQGSLEDDQGAARARRRPRDACARRSELGLVPPRVRAAGDPAGTRFGNVGRPLLQEAEHALAHVGAGSERVDERGVEPVGGHRVRLAEHAPQHRPGERDRDRRGDWSRSPRASAYAAGSRSSGSCTERTSPPASASSAPKTRPVAHHSIARLIPTTRGRNHDEHASGTSPRRANTKPNFAGARREPHVERQRHRDADADRRAVDRADHRLGAVEEPQRHEPALVAVAAVGLAHHAPAGGDVAVGVERRVATTEVGARAEAPAAPVTTTARTSGSASTSSIAAHSSCCIVTVNAFRRSGRSRVMVATWSATS